jgi:polyhydroxybutyrate depolymerase
VRTIRILIAVAAVSITVTTASTASGSSTTAEQPAAGGLTEHTLVVDGIERTYRTYLPERSAAGPLPVVFVLHGGGGNAARMYQPGHPPYRWQELAEQHGLLVVYPESVEDTWHDCRSDAHHVIGTADDVGFFRAMIERLGTDHPIDRARIYAAGTSNGGMMSYRLAMELTDSFAAVGAVIANMPADPAGECAEPTRPISVAIMNGDADPRMPWDGGDLERVGHFRGAVRSAHDTRDYWVAHNDADRPPAAHRYPDRDRADGTTVSRLDYDGDNASVAFFRVHGGGHTEPSIAYPYPDSAQRLVGPQSHDLEYADELWEFFRNKTR